MSKEIILHCNLSRISLIDYHLNIILTRKIQFVKIIIKNFLIKFLKKLLTIKNNLIIIKMN
nr:MAG TPA: hypothetical protein [Caudoviricetes sp.]